MNFRLKIPTDDELSNYVNNTWNTATQIIPFHLPRSTSGRVRCHTDYRCSDLQDWMRWAAIAALARRTQCSKFFDASSSTRAPAGAHGRTPAAPRRTLMKVEFGLFNWGDAIQSGTVFPADIHTKSLPVQDYLEDTDVRTYLMCMQNGSHVVGCLEAYRVEHIAPIVEDHAMRCLAFASRALTVAHRLSSVWSEAIARPVWNCSVSTTSTGTA